MIAKQNNGIGFICSGKADSGGLSLNQTGTGDEIFPDDAVSGAVSVADDD